MSSVGSDDWEISEHRGLRLIIGEKLISFAFSSFMGRLRPANAFGAVRLARKP